MSIISNNIPKQNKYIKQTLINQFQNSLSIAKINDLWNKLNENNKDEKVSHKKFTSVFTNVFENTHLKIEELIFARFKNLQCSIINKKDKFYITKITTEDEINIYELCSALTVFVKCEYIDKIKFLFNLTDSDDDGYLNEMEISKLIMSLNIIFCEEETPIQTGSTVLNQSLINIKTTQSLNKLLYHPGELKRVLKEEHCITFNTFYDSLKKIPDYKYQIIPCFVDLKQCLLNERNERINIRNNIKDDFINATNDIITPINLLYTNYSEKNLFSKKLKKFYSKPKGNNKNIYTKNPNWRISLIGKEIQNQKLERKSFYFRSAKNIMDRDTLPVNYNEIINMEANPMIINFENSKEEEVVKKKVDRKSVKVPLLPRISRRRSAMSKIKIPKKPKTLVSNASSPGYLTTTELFKEIAQLSKVNKGEDINTHHIEMIEDQFHKEVKLMTTRARDKCNSLGSTMPFWKIKFRNEFISNLNI